jgi:Glycosyl hydrolase family 99
LRGTFYYANYNDESSWENSRFQPTLGSYSSSDPVVIQNHIAALKYGKMDLAILSWLGQDLADASHRPRTRMLLDETIKQDAPMKWTFYYESAETGDLSLDVIQNDLEYLKTWFTRDQTWAHMDGKPVLFVNNGTGCNVVERWMQATSNEWFIVLRVFDNFEDCEVQPDSWHEQLSIDDSNGVDTLEGYYFSLSPGEWQSQIDEPTIERMTGNQWCYNVREMEGSGETWPLIVSFDNAETGTSVESSLDWESDSGYGLYLDCLHNSRLM